MNCNYKVKITDIQTKYKFKVFCTGYDDSEIKEKIDAMYQAWPKASGEGETPTLDNTANATMSIDLKGNTSQYTTTGKNLCNSTNQSTPVGSGITFTPIYENGLLQYIDVNGTSTSVCYIDIGSASYPSGTYTVTGSPSGGSNDTYQQRFISGATALGYDNGSGTNVTLNEATTCTLRIRIANGYTANHLKFYPMIRLSSVTDDTYEPYTNGASPNPDYPQDVHVVTGDNTIKVEGKNYCNGINQYVFLNVAVNQCGTNSGDSGLYIPVTSNTYTISTKITQARYRVACSKNIPTQVAQTVYRGVNKDGTSNSITIDTTGYYYLIVNATDLTAIQIEKGAEATEYAPYQSQSYAVNLGTMELCKIGTYQDYIYKDNKKWYKYGVIGKVVLNGSERGWGRSGASTSSVFVGALNLNQYGIGIYSKQGVASNWLTNRFSYGTLGNINKFNVYNPDATYGYNNIGFGISTDIVNDLESFKTWVASSNLVFYYILATPTTTEITNTTLISQLEALKQAESYSGQTNISQTNDDKPFILTAKALKDLSNL